jgi:hypothetical protein
MRSQARDALGKLAVSRDDGAAVSECSERLRRMEAETAEAPETPDGATAVGRAERLCRIFDERNASIGREQSELVELGGLTVEVDGDDRSSARTERATDSARIER